MISEPVSPATPPEAEPSILAHSLRYGKTVTQFAAIQIVVQAIGFLSGILVVRLLDRQEYAYFTIANTMQGTLNVLADIGISVGVVSIGGRVWQDRWRFGQLVNTALQLRRWLGLASVAFVTPVLYFMLVRNGASPSYTLLIIVLILLGLGLQLSIGVLGVVPRLHSSIRLIQTIDLSGMIARLALIAGFALLFLNAGTALAIGSLTMLLQYWLLRRYVAKTVDLTASINHEDRSAMLGFIKNLAANAAFYCFQGQITILLISFFGTRTTGVAEVGALGRLAMIFTILSNLLTNIFVPAFARCQSARRLLWQYWGIIAAVAAFSLVVTATAALFPDQFLFVLGHNYAHLNTELLLMVGGAVLNALTGTFWSLNASKAWIAGSWLYIPLTVCTQIALIPLTNFSTVKGVLVFNLLSAVPNLLLNIALGYRGFRSLKPVEE